MPAFMRVFEGGATRDADDNKPEYAGFLSPMVIRRFGEYMNKHRVQADGNLRASDNWKKGMPRRVYLESLLRHTLDVWEEVTGDGARVTGVHLEEALCAVIFNAQGLLREVMMRRDLGVDDSVRNQARVSDLTLSSKDSRAIIADVQREIDRYMPTLKDGGYSPTPPPYDPPSPTPQSGEGRGMAPGLHPRFRDVDDDF